MSILTRMFVLSIALVFSLSSYSQKFEGESNRKYYKRIANEQIVTLKNGVLLVRLHSKSKTITALKNAGHDDKAEKVKTEQEKYNKKIVEAFDNFDFCKIYFFYSEMSAYIVDKQFEKVDFLDRNLKADKTIKPDCSRFLTAEFGTVEQDTAKRYSHTTYEEGEDGRIKEVDNYYGSSDMGFGALVIKSDRFVQLNKPFPYYVRTYDTFFNGRKPHKVVRKLNKKLNKFYNKSH